MRFGAVTNHKLITDANLNRLSSELHKSNSNSSSCTYRKPITHPKVLYLQNLLKPPSPPRIPRDTLQPKHGLISHRETKPSTMCKAQLSNLTTERIFTQKSEVKLNISVNKLLSRRNRSNSADSVQE